MTQETRWYLIRFTSFDGPPSIANRAIIPKNIKANNRMNFTVFTPLIWTRQQFIHIFFIFSWNNKSWQGVGAMQIIPHWFTFAFLLYGYGCTNHLSTVRIQTWGIFHPNCISRNIQHTVLVAEFRIRGRFECIWIDFFHIGQLAIQQKDVPVDGPGAACPAAAALKPGRPDLTRQTF